MLDLYANINKIRRRIFEEVAKTGYENRDLSTVLNMPYEILNSLNRSYRSSIFLERAIVAERIRMAFGLPARTFERHTPITTGLEEANIAEKYYEPPLVNIIDFACNACPTDSYVVTNLCQGCIASPCVTSCHKGAIKFVDGKSVIDQDLCIKCGKCHDACPYHAIAHRERPCAKACGVNAIESDEKGKAKINYDKCVSCGMCLVNCPFGAIVDKSQIFQVIKAIQSETPVYAIMAPAFIGQFGPKVNLKTIDDAMEKLGFTGVYEVSIGADLCTVSEAEEFVEKVPHELDFMLTSCCASWRVMIKRQFPELADKLSMSLTPMVLTARLVKKMHPGCKVVFVGPCSAKKLEASRVTVRSDVDFVLTFEELMGMFVAKNVDFNTLEQRPLKNITSRDGRGFAVNGGVAQAVVNLIKSEHPDLDVHVECASGLADCRQILELAKQGKFNGCLIEGMACPMGCSSGAGTINASNKTKILVGLSQKETPVVSAGDSQFLPKLETLD